MKLEDVSITQQGAALKLKGTVTHARIAKHYARRHWRQGDSCALDSMALWNVWVLKRLDAGALALSSGVVPPHRLVDP